MLMAQPGWPVQQFRDLLDRVLADTGLSQGRLAQIAPVTQSQISRWKAGSVRPKYDTLLAFADALLSAYPELNTSRQEILAAGGYEDAGTATTPREATPSAPADLWRGLNWDDLDPAERMIWHLPDTSAETRFRMMEMYRFLEKQVPARIEQIRRGVGEDESRFHRGANGA